MTHQEQRPFVVGDRVKAFRENGVVKEVNALKVYPVIVEFDGGSIESFTLAGRLFDTHKTPSLKHRKFKPKAKPREFWVLLDMDSNPRSVFNSVDDVRIPFQWECLNVREVRKGRK